MDDIKFRSDLVLFLKEFRKRFKANTPKFHTVIGNISLIMSGIGLIPDTLNYLDVTLPEKWMLYLGKAIFLAGLYGKLVSKLTVSKPTAEMMPFTEKKEIQKEQKDELK